MNNLSGLPRELIAKCILKDNFKESIKNAAIWSLISKVFYEIIESKEFLKVLVSIDGVRNFWPRIHQIKELNLSQFCQLRKSYLKKTEEFSGLTLGDAWADEEGVNLFSFFKGLGPYQLKKNAEINLIAFPENMPLDLSHSFVSPPSIARSDDYLAVHGSDSFVHIYKPDGKEYLHTFDVQGQINQITIQGKCLYVIEQGFPCNLIVFDLELEQQIDKHPLVNYDSSTPICFGKEYLIYSTKLVIGKGVLALSLSDLQMKMHDAALTFGQSYFYPMNDGFIGVNFTDLFVCDIQKISFEEGCMKRTTIKENLKISKSFTALRMDVCFHDDRLIVAYREGGVGTKLFSYDLLLDRLIPLHTIPSKEFHHKEDSFKPRFLCLAEKIYYLYMTSPGNDEHKSSLTTLNFSKL